VNELAFLVGRVIEEVRYGHGLRIVFELGDRVEPALYADVGRFRFTDAGGNEHEVDTDDPVSVGVALAMVGQKVVKAGSDGRAALELELSDGSSLQCEPDERFEAWQVVGGSPECLVVCLPAGELAVWDSRTPAIKLEPERQSP
jgi:Family of unknown function (DUF6188)